MKTLRPGGVFHAREAGYQCVLQFGGLRLGTRIDSRLGELDVGHDDSSEKADFKGLMGVISEKA